MSIVENAGTERRLAALQQGRPSYELQAPGQLEDLHLRIRQTAAWCDAHVDMRAVDTCLRPPSIWPRPLASNRWDTVDSVVSSRKTELWLKTLEIGSTNGRLLVYFPDEDLTDGAACEASEGFFDTFNAPPCGTWVGYFEEEARGISSSAHLLAWVPEALIDLANKGLNVNPEECIKWLGDTDIELRGIVESSRLGNFFRL